MPDTTTPDWICGTCGYPVTYHELAARSDRPSGSLQMSCPPLDANVEDVAPISHVDPVARQAAMRHEEKAAGWAVFVVVTGFAIGAWAVIPGGLYGAIKLIGWLAG